MANSTKNKIKTLLSMNQGDKPVLDPRHGGDPIPGGEGSSTKTPPKANVTVKGK